MYFVDLKKIYMNQLISFLLVIFAILHTGVTIKPLKEFEEISNGTLQDKVSQTNHTHDSQETYTATTTKPNNDSLSDFPEPEYYVESEDYYAKTPPSPTVLETLRNDYFEMLPDFNDSSLRISEIKCKEYLWGVDKREADLELNVIGGRDANPSEFPHMAAIGWATGRRPQWIFKCGGALISDKFVLTAGHCSKTTKRDSSVSDLVPKIVRLGEIRVDIAAKAAKHDYDIEKIIVHPDYKPPIQYYDIALIELKKRIPLFEQKVHPACLWSKDDTGTLGKKALVTGWGVIRQEPLPVVSPLLQVGDVEIIDDEMCHELLLPSCNRKQCGVRDHQICAGILAGGVDACQGDSGGPLQVKIQIPYYTAEEKIYYVIGVTSYGIGCAEAESPGVYTRVSSFIDWIEDIVWPS